MSNNKLKYFEVQEITVVAANNKRDAVALAHGRRGVSGRVLSQTGETTRISAAEAKSEQQSLTA
jgi:hypothetical protein